MKKSQPANRAKISARAEIRYVIGPLAGLKFRLCLLNKSSQKDVCDCMERLSAQDGSQPWLKAQFHKPSWKFKKTSCNRFQISARAEKFFWLCSVIVFERNKMAVLRF